MFIDPIQDATAPTVPPCPDTLPQYPFETVRHMVFGSPIAVQLTIQDLHNKHYAEPNDWSRPISTGRPNEIMVILTQKVRVA